MQDHYKTLGLNSSATPDEIRRAYRILARRYHPDLNPGDVSEDRFKTISLAYAELSDPQKRQAYDLEYESQQISRFSERLKAYHKQQDQSGRREFGDKSAKTGTGSGAARRPAAKPTDINENVVYSASKFLKSGLKRLRKLIPSSQNRIAEERGTKLSIIEVSVGIQDAIKGVKKTIEIQDGDGPRKLSVEIPSGVRNGSVVRLKERRSKNTPEEIVLIIRLATHPVVSIQPKGLIVELPISLREALEGASITVPTLDEPAVIKVPQGSQSGNEIRLKGRGIKLRDGSRGDLIYRLIIKIPTAYTAVGLSDLSAQFDKYYEEPLRKSLPNTLLDL